MCANSFAYLVNSPVVTKPFLEHDEADKAEETAHHGRGAPHSEGRKATVLEDERVELPAANQ